MPNLVPDQFDIDREIQESIDGRHDIRRLLRRIQKQLNSADAARVRSDSREDVVIKEKGTLGINSASVMFGLTANRPTADYMLTRGVRSLIYHDTEADILYGWNGLAWKSTSLT